MKSKKITALLILVTIMYMPAIQAQTVTPFTNASSLPAANQNATITNFQVQEQHGKLLFDWAVDNNELANVFELEKSSNGKQFATAALIFSTEKKDTDHYQYFEKAAGKRNYFRLKMTDKNNQVYYSSILIFPAS